MRVQVPGEGEYLISLFDGVKGFVEAGRVHGNVLEFQAGAKQVRIVCNRAIVDSDLPIFVRRQP